MIDRQLFFNSIRKSLFKKMSQTQVNGMNAILDEWDRLQLADYRWVAYMLATTYHETGFTMEPIEEWGKGKGKEYGKVDPITGERYYGRGFVQLTWKANYQRAQDELHISLVNEPELALNLRVATQVLFQGMIGGWFTGKKLSRYFDDRRNDPYNARKIVNGLDKAHTIAGYHDKFLKAIISPT